MLLTHLYLLERYGPLMTEAEIAAVLKYDAGTVENLIYRGKLPLQRVEGLGKKLYRTEDVARLIESLRPSSQPQPA